PPFRDPFNYNFDPLVVVQLDLVAAAMHSRFEAEGKPGVTMRSGARYSTWWNGGLRTTAYFHNMIGILTETIGNPTPMRIPYVADKVLPRADLPNPIQPQEWHFRRSIDYSVTANRAILDLAARNRENFLFNIYRMGKNSIERGSRDSWTVTASEAQQANEAFAQRQGGQRPAAGGPGGGGAPPATAPAFDPYAAVLHAPGERDPRAYVIPSDQPDFLTAIKFVNALREVNVAVHRATAPFEVQGKQYPAGSFVVFTAQAFRPHLLDMFEPQDHPNDFPYPGAPPTAPYDNAGWTLAYTMGVKFDRVLEGFAGPFERLTDWNVKPPAGTVTATGRPAGYVTSHRVNDAFRAVSRLLADGEDVQWIGPAGTLYLPARGTTRARLDRLAAELGVSFSGVSQRPAGEGWKLRQPRIGLLDVYGGSMPSGWTRWVLEQFGIPHERTYPPRLEQGNLNARYDVLVFPDGTLPDLNRPAGQGGPGGGRRDEPVSPAANDSIEAALPAEYRNQRGRVTARTLAAIRRFVEQGGTVIAIGSSTPGLATALGLPVSDHLVENGEPLPRTKFYVPGSVLRAAVDTSHPLAAGLGAEVDVVFDGSPAFALAPDAAAKGVTRVAWFASKAPLRSGWAWGQEHLEDGVAVLEAKVGRGRVYLFGPEILDRGQPHGTFKFLFNALYFGTATRSGN
ncbi:MAG TPA: peptidase, partial [Gemmatimonadales bacterium]|nr:peptidase [Gemmatimonadales bacterium]